MPFKSQAQRRFMYAEHPQIAERFQSETPAHADLPEHVGGKMQKKQKRDPHMEAISDLHSMLGEAIAQKMHAHMAKKADMSKQKADGPGSQMDAGGEAMDADDAEAQKKKLHFGAKGK